MRAFLLIFSIAVSTLLALPATADQLDDAALAIDRKDYSRAAQLLEPLAEAGDSTAQMLLGNLYNRGEGVPENPSTAVKWLRKAAEQSVSLAQVGLGFALYSGRGVEQNKVEAAKWFTNAAEQDEPDAQAMLAHMYAAGEGGLTQSLVESYKWVLIAGEAGGKLATATKLTLETFMRKTQQQEAIQLAEQWKFKKGKIKQLSPPVDSDNQVGAVYFFTARQLLEKCSQGRAGAAWCEAYIAGVIDTLGSGRGDLASDAKDTLLCLSKKISLSEAKRSVLQGIADFSEEGQSTLLSSSAANSVIAGVLVYLCE